MKGDSAGSGGNGMRCFRPLGWSLERVGKETGDVSFQGCSQNLGWFIGAGKGLSCPLPGEFSCL